MSVFNLFKRRPTAPVARERLKVLLAHERARKVVVDDSAPPRRPLSNPAQRRRAAFALLA